MVLNESLLLPLLISFSISLIFSPASNMAQPAEPPNPTSAEISIITTLHTTISESWTPTYTVPVQLVTLATFWFSSIPITLVPVTGIYQDGSFSPQTSQPIKSLPITPTGPASGSTPLSGVSSSSATNISSAITSHKANTSKGVTSQVPSSTSSQHVNTHTGLSTGAITGIAVGCAVGGTLLGFLFGFLLFRCRRKPKRQIEHVPVQYLPEGKDLPPAPTSDRLQLDRFLLDAKPDAEIETELRSLGQLIEQHVENNYHLQPVQRSPNALAQTLANLGLGQEESSSTINIASLAIDPRTRLIALRHVISRVTFESISLDSHASISLLPAFAGSFMQSVPPTEGRRGSPDAVNVALTRWRQISAFLLHENRSERTPLTPSEDVSTRQAQQLAVALGRFLGAFVSSEREVRYEQENHLREVIVECATFGYLLFSQPSEFRFRYGDEGGKSSSGLVTCPGLDKISDEDGHRYASPYTLVAPVIEGTHASHASA